MTARDSGRTEARPRVFVSSVIEGYLHYREAARQGIRLAGSDPVLAEDFEAQGISPRNACLDGVQSSDAFVLLLGARYGWTAPSGQSATEEEYEEARRLHLPILAFVQAGVAPEPQQRGFQERVEDYIDGHFRKSFQEANDLKRLVEKAVLAADLGGVSGPPQGAVTKISQTLGRRPENTQYTVWMKTSWTTQRDEEVVDPVHLDDTAFKQTLQRLAHSGDLPLFSYEERKRTESTASRLRVVQGDLQSSMPGEHATVVSIHSGGTFTILQNVTGAAPQDTNYSIASMYRLDPDVVCDRLRRAWSLAAAWWNDHDSFRRHDPLLYGVGFYNVGSRSFARVADYTPGGGLPVPPECPENPLIVFDQPRRVTRSALNAPQPEIDRIIKTVKIRFREWANNPW